MRPSWKCTFFSVLISVLLASCNGKQPAADATVETTPEAFDLEAAKARIQEQTQAFTQAHITKDTAYLNGSFTADARVLPPNSPAVTGQKDIAQLNADWVNYGIHEFTEVSTAFYGDENYLVDEGTYYLRYGEENTIDEGKYINIWKNEDGTWKLYSNIWNTSLPLE
ncbi:nuclear transport factor 2 family protein [Robiginitalea sediminis]|uniref:nuclear transport factor 2 family protein n=1 Tax=Robiginitalea sediminis TaxID=1982593 RepID=UPI000B4AC0EC|nr:nuclear transport factor 2 family protein [Robiginitalea sediminis]